MSIRTDRQFAALQRAMQDRLEPRKRLHRRLLIALIVLGWPVLILVLIVLWRLVARATDAAVLLQGALS